MDDEDPCLHRHQFQQLYFDLVIGGSGGNCGPVRDSNVDFLQSIGEVGDDSLAEVVVHVDGDDLAPTEGLDENT